LSRKWPKQQPASFSVTAKEINPIKEVKNM
jgi:hypothetical protein